LHINNHRCYVLCIVTFPIGCQMRIKHNVPAKTIGHQTARLLVSLYDRAQSTFTLGDAQEITGLSSRLASSLLHKSVRRGVVSRLKPGAFVIVPPELGSASDYAGDPYLTAKRLAGSAPCFISHASAMEIHRMVTQPQLVVFASSSNRLRSRTLHDTEFRFVFIRPEHYFGTMKHWHALQGPPHRILARCFSPCPVIRGLLHRPESHRCAHSANVPTAPIAGSFPAHPASSERSDS